MLILLRRGEFFSRVFRAWKTTAGFFVAISPGSVNRNAI
jgi:hypothetical protein